MSKLLSRDILPELFRLEIAFRDAVRDEVLYYDTETLLSEAQRCHSQWSGGQSVRNMTDSIIRDEAIKILWLKHGQSAGS